MVKEEGNKVWFWNQIDTLTKGIENIDKNEERHSEEKERERREEVDNEWEIKK